MKHHLTIPILLSLSVLVAHGATYYVTTTGNDGSAGSVGAPWLTIQRSVTTAAAGDTVNVGPGTFTGYVTNTASGTAGNPIVFSGTRGTHGEFLTIIDPSVLVTASWVAAPEIGSGVWKQTGLPFETKVLFIGGKRVAFVHSTNTINDVPFDYTPAITKGVHLLTLPSAAVVGIHGGRAFPQYWDGIGALWASQGSTTFLRLRDGSNPSSLTIRIAPNMDGVWTPDWVYDSVVRVEAKSYITWKNFQFRGAWCGFYAKGNCTGLLVCSNSFLLGSFGIRCESYSGSSVRNSTFSNNDISGSFYGYTGQGAWEGPLTTTKSQISELLYEQSKYAEGDGGSDQYGISFYTAGASNVISGNFIHDTIGNGLLIGSDSGYPICSNTVVSGNTFSGHPSTAIVMIGYTDGTQIHDNFFSDCNGQVRYTMDDVGQSHEAHYLYRNKFWLPQSEGDHLFFHVLHSPSSTTFWPTVWVYHNSMVGGLSAVDFVTQYAIANGGHHNLHIVDNIFSGGGNYTRFNDGFTNSVYVGEFDYNLLAHSPTSPYDVPAWRGSHNIIQSGAEWALPGCPTYQIKKASAAVNAAKTLAGVPDNVNRVGAAWDMGAIEFKAGKVPRVQAGKIKGR